MKFREEILSQIQVILKSVESIVRQLSCPESNSNLQCQNYDEFWWDNHQDVKNENDLDFSFNLSESDSNVSSLSAAPLPVYKEMSTLVLESALVATINQETEDTAPPLRVSPSLGSVIVTEEEEEMSIAERVLHRRRAACHPRLAP